MDIEQLTKSQLVLLMLLVAFVSSIATSIVTVQLLEGEPPAITQTINRVVERTIERVVPVEVDSGKKEVVVKETEVTVVVKEDDLITESIENTKRSLVRIVRVATPVEESTATTSSDALENGIFVGIGVIILSDGTFVASADSVSVGENFVGVFFDGAQFPLEVGDINEGSSIVLLRPVLDENAVRTFSNTKFADMKGLKLGQTVISLGGEERTNVSIGIISGFENANIEIPADAESGKDTVTKEVLSSVNTNITSAQISGSPLINIFGEFVGINTISKNTSGVFEPSYKAKDTLTEQNTSETVSSAVDTKDDVAGES